MKIIPTIAFIIAVTTMSHAGTITGTVRAEATPAPEGSEGGGKYDSRKYKFAERIDYSALRDFVVYIEGTTGTNTASTGNSTAVVTTKKVSQRGAVFAPHVLPIMVGTTVEWPNNDDIFHNVFSMSDAMPFDLGLYKSPEVKSVKFDKPGRVDVFCSIHSSMNCVVLVLPNSHFAVSDANGRYSITNVPAGTYKLKAWHERMPSQISEITVTEDGIVKADFVLGVKNLPKY